MEPTNEAQLVIQCTFFLDNQQQIQHFASKHKESAFDKHIAKLLQKTTTQPILKTGLNELSGKESYELLIKSTSVRYFLYEEFCKFINLTKNNPESTEKLHIP